MRGSRVAAVWIGLTLVLAGCGTETAPGAGGGGSAGGAESSAAPSPSGLDVASLIGTWSVTGADVAAGQTVTMSPFEMTLWVPCGHASGSWRASPSGLFAGDVDGWSGTCTTKPSFPWLDDAATWRPDGTSFRLVDSEGQEVAVLAPAPAPTDKAYAGIRVPDQSSLTDETRAGMNAAPSMGAGVAGGATRGLLVGAWVAVPPATTPADNAGLNRETPGFTLAQDGMWTGTDGCNGAGGRWNADAEGRIVATSGPSTKIGCNNIDAPRWLGGAWLAGFTADGTLVLFDYQGTELGRLTRG